MQHFHRQHVLINTTSGVQEQVQKLPHLSRLNVYKYTSTGLFSTRIIWSFLPSTHPLHRQHFNHSFRFTNRLHFPPHTTTDPLVPLDPPINNPQASNDDFNHEFDHEGISRSHLCLRHPSLSRSRCGVVALPQHRCYLLAVHSHQLDLGPRLWCHPELEMGAQTQQKNMQESCGGSDGCWRSCF
jgi:hypothetical protein